MVKIFIWVILSVVLVIQALGCEVERECFLCPEPSPCEKISGIEGDLFITGFESGDHLEQWGGYLNTWQDTFLTTGISIGIDSVTGGSNNSERFARIGIANNTGNPAGWTGGGGVVIFSGCPEGMDLSGYDTLLLDVKMFPGGKLDETRVKLVDNIGNATPERYLSQFGKFPSEQWQTIRIPLDWFGFQLPSDSLAHRWQALDIRHVIGLATVSVQDGSTPGAVDGALGVDEISVVKK